MSEKTLKVYEFLALDAYTFWERFVIRIAGLLFFLSIKLIGLTIRFETDGAEIFDEITTAGKLPIHCFWHDRIFAGTYYFRNRGIIVMSSHSFDSEYTARCIQRFGFGIVKGSSTRGGIGALVGMIRVMQQGLPTAFTVDGPKGPRYEAKMGSILLAKKTGNPIVPFTIEVLRHWNINSWDRLQIPKPFSRAKVFIGKPIYVKSDAKDDELEEKRLELQNSLDNLVEQGEKWAKPD